MSISVRIWMECTSTDELPEDLKINELLFFKYSPINSSDLSQHIKYC